MKEEKIIELLYAWSKVQAEIPRPGLADDIKARIPEVLPDQTESFDSPRLLYAWRHFLPNRINRIAAAVLILIGLAGLFMIFSPAHNTNNQALADIVQPILTDHSVVFNIFYQGVKSNWTTHIKNLQGQISLESMPGDRTIVFDYNTSSALVLSEANKQALFVDFVNIFGTRRSYLDHIREAVDWIKNDPLVEVESLGHKWLEGKTAVGFSAKGKDEEIVVWADTATMLPIRIEQKTKNTSLVCKDFQFDVKMDEPLFYLEVPQGYTLNQNQSQLSDYSEKDFITALRLWTGVVRDGCFPDSISLMNWYQNSPDCEKKFQTEGMDKALWEKIKLQIARGMVYLNILKVRGDWQYRGQGVRLGDEQTPVFWYRNDNEPEIYRVIYGDLHVAQVSARAISSW